MLPYTLLALSLHQILRVSPPPPPSIVHVSIIFPSIVIVIVVNIFSSGRGGFRLFGQRRATSPVSDKFCTIGKVGRDRVEKRASNTNKLNYPDGCVS